MVYLCKEPNVQCSDIDCFGRLCNLRIVQLAVSTAFCMSEMGVQYILWLVGILLHIFWFLHIFCYCSIGNHLVSLLNRISYTFEWWWKQSSSQYHFCFHSVLSNEPWNNHMYLRHNAKISSQICSRLFHPFCGHFW